MLNLATHFLNLKLIIKSKSSSSVFLNNQNMQNAFNFIQVKATNWEITFQNIANHIPTESNK